MTYEERRALRTKNAEENTKRREVQYAKEIKESKENTIIYNREEILDFWSEEPVKRIPKIEVSDCDSVQAICKYRLLEHEDTGKNDYKLAILNFASFKHPGGGYIRGTHAQEECLCEKSFLYNVLSKFEDTWYKDNLNYANDSLYADRGLYSPNVLFLENGGGSICKCDVITVACPNLKSFIERKKGKPNIDELNYQALYNRCRFILEIAKRQKVYSLILGAFGCGVFKQNPENVANIFRELLNKYDYGLYSVEFAIPAVNNQSKTDNYKVFKDTFSN